MRFFVSLVALAALAAAAATVDEFERVFINIFGECGGKCIGTAYEEGTNCGDPSSSSSNACCCGLGLSDLGQVDLTSAVTCVENCGDADYSLLANSDALANKLAAYKDELCGSSTETSVNSSTQDLAATPSATASSSSDDSSSSAPSSTTTDKPTSVSPSSATTTPHGGDASMNPRGGPLGVSLGIAAAYFLL